MLRFLSLIFAVALAGCVVPPPPAPPKPAPVAHRAAPPDWFQQQLAEARQARASHLPKTDTAGAEADYDRVVRAACTHVAISGPEKYQARCATILKPATAPESDPFACNPNSTDPVALQECND